MVWMPKELKILLEDDLKKRFTEQGVPDLLDKIADETVATEAHEVRSFLEKVGHPAIKMEDMGNFAQSETTVTAPEKPIEKVAGSIPGEERTDVKPETMPEKESPAQISENLIEEIKAQITREVSEQLKTSITKNIVQEIIKTLNDKFLGNGKDAMISLESSSSEKIDEKESEETIEPAKATFEIKHQGPSAAERLAEVKTFTIRKEKNEIPIWTVKLGATKAEGGTRGKTYTVGGATCMPFHLWEGEMPFRPLVAMEVFDSVSEKYPKALRNIYGDLLFNPAEMAKVCVEKFGADLVSVRLEGTHPEKGNRTPEQSVELVQSILKAVDVPLIVTGHSNFERINDVMKAVAQACAGENLLLNWVEQDNYRTIAGAALAYGHSIVSQSPIDVNISKQMNILLTNMDIKPEQIVMDPLTGSMGYGIEYTYSVMERIRLTGLNGDKMLTGPMIVTTGQECIKVKEFNASEKDFPEWGDLNKRAAMWELSTAVNLLYAGADILIMYHPEAAMAVKRTIFQLRDQTTSP